MATKRHGQRWILDALIGVGGWDILHPEVGPFFQQLGYNAADIARVFGQVKASGMIKDGFAAVGAEVEAKAEYWTERGYTTAAASLYNRAALLYGRTYYSYYSDDPRRAKFQNCVTRCFDRVIEQAAHHVERVKVPFEGKHVYGLFEAPKGAKAQPCLILLPGMDMFKEDWHRFISDYVVPRGWTAFAMDGPGQGESLTNGLKVNVDNYEAAASRVIDWLGERPEVDAEQIVLMGTSMGSYWGTRIAATDKRLRACATNMANYGDKHIIFNVAQPNFKSNFMYMAGIEDEDEFDRLAAILVNDDKYPAIECPVLMVTGEYDELTELKDTFAAYDLIKAPKELWVYGSEFHPMGPASNEWLTASFDWLADALTGAFKANYSRKIYITRSGDYREGSGEPPTWNPRQS